MRCAIKVAVCACSLAFSLAVGIGVAGTPLARAQTPASRESPSVSLTGGLPRSLPTPGDGVQVRTIFIRPKAADAKAHSRLIPSRDQWQPGNAAPIFLRQNFEATQALKLLRETYANKDFDVSLEELNVAAVRAGTPLRLGELRRAAYRERAGWEYPLQEERMAFILLPDVQETRIYFRALTLAARADIKEGKLADAIDKITIALGLARHVGETPFLICKLVQKSHCDSALGAVEELLQHPDSDNLYWALSSLPRPLISATDALQMEVKMLGRTFPMLQNDDERLTEDEWRKLAAEAIELIVQSSPDVALPKAGSPEADKLLADWVILSRERLPRVRPDWQERVAKMSDPEVGLRYWFERLRQRSHELLAVGSLEYPLGLPRWQALERQQEEEAADELPVRLGGVGLSGANFYRTVALADQRVALLRAIEAIRDWSSRHDGKLPASLDVLDVPAPLDCLANQPFSYTLAADGKSATLEGQKVASTQRGPDGQKRPVTLGYRYELRLAP